MKILYGVVGEGMGHATRSRVVLEHLHAQGHEVLVVVSNRAFEMLRAHFAGHGGPGSVTVKEIAGLSLVYDGGEVDKSESFIENLGGAPDALRHNVAVYEEVVGSFTPDVVISDFESFAWFLGRRGKIPVISIDNMQIINRCSHPLSVNSGPRGLLPAVDFQIAKLSVKAKLPGAWHYLVSSFFFPPVRKARTTLVPPILRPEVLAATRAPGEHILVYQTSQSNRALLDILSTLPWTFRVYGLGTTRPAGLGDNITLRPFSQTGFIDDLRTARAVVAGGGYSLMGEAVHLRVPMLAIPLRKQFEQELNARYLAALGYGDWATGLDEGVLRDFLARLPDFEAALATYTPRDNTILLACLDELLLGIAAGKGRPEVLESPNLGAWVP